MIVQQKRCAGRAKSRESISRELCEKRRIMTFTSCSRCNESLHLKINSSEAANELRSKEDSGKILCIRCFKTNSEYDVVEVISANESVLNAQIGDKGAATK